MVYSAKSLADTFSMRAPVVTAKPSFIAQTSFQIPDNPKCYFTESDLVLVLVVPVSAVFFYLGACRPRTSRGLHRRVSSTTFADATVGISRWEPMVTDLIRICAPKKRRNPFCGCKGPSYSQPFDQILEVSVGVYSRKKYLRTYGFFPSAVSLL